MSSNWKPFTLSRLLGKFENWIQINPTEIYKEVTVKLWGKGVVLRKEIEGAAIASAKRNRIHAGQFILSRIDARNGAFGLVPEVLDGAVVSNDFPVFTPNEDLIDATYLKWLSKTNDFVELCKRASEGTTNRVRLDERKFLSLEINIPPLFEQQQIVACIESLVTKIDKAITIESTISDEIDALLASAREAAFRPASRGKNLTVGDLCESPQYGYTASAVTEPIGPHLLRITDIQDGEVNWGSVPFCNCPTPEKYLLKDNDIVFARTGATTGKSFLIRHCPESVFASYLIRLRVKRDVSPEYLYEYFQSPLYWDQIKDEKEGTGQPNVNGKKLLTIRVPVPPASEQKKIVDYLQMIRNKIYDAKKLRSKVNSELDAFIPSILDKAFKGERS